MKLIPEQFIKKAIENPLLSMNCKEFHPHSTCNRIMINQFFNTGRISFKSYIVIHLLGLILFRRKKLK